MMRYICLAFVLGLFSISSTMADPDFVACFFPGTSPSYISKINNYIKAHPIRARRARPSEDFKWVSTATNPQITPGRQTFTLTWSFVPDGTPIAGSLGEPANPSDLIAFLDGIYGSTGATGALTARPWFAVFQSIFQAWSKYLPVTYVYEPNDDKAPISFSKPGVLGVRGDIRIGGHFIDGTSNTLAYNFFPTSGDMIIDTGDLAFSQGSAELRTKRLFIALAHEHGHGLGLDHTCPLDNTKLMEPFINLNLNGPALDDIHGAQYMYGDSKLPDLSKASALSLGLLSTASSISYGTDTVVSIDRANYVDYYSFVPATDLTATITLTPSGRTYPEAAQGDNNQCPSGTPLNSAAVLDLTVSFETINNVLIGPLNNFPIGFPELLTTGTLTAGTTYYIGVGGTGTAQSAQIYNLTVIGTSVNPTIPTIPSIPTFPTFPSPATIPNTVTIPTTSKLPSTIITTVASVTSAATTKSTPVPPISAMLTKTALKLYFPKMYKLLNTFKMVKFVNGSPALRKTVFALYDDKIGDFSTWTANDVAAHIYNTNLSYKKLSALSSVSDIFEGSYPVTFVDGVLRINNVKISSNPSNVKTLDGIIQVAGRRIRNAV